MLANLLILLRLRAVVSSKDSSAFGNFSIVGGLKSKAQIVSIKYPRKKTAALALLLTIYYIRILGRGYCRVEWWPKVDCLVV